MDEPPVWYSPSARRWWIEPLDDPRLGRRMLERHEDAIHVTNAYTVLPHAFIDLLVAEAKDGYQWMS